MERNLFSPLQLRSVELKNRIVMSPMCQYMADDGLPSAWHSTHYSSRSVGGTGMVMVEMTAVEAEGRITPGCLGIWTDTHGEALALVAQSIKAQGSVAAIQIAHAGRKGSRRRPWDDGGASLPSTEGWELLAPSAIAYGSYDLPISMSAQDIERLSTSFADAARRAVNAGFEVVEIHMAHGYLLHQFLSPLSNQRSDEYGGSLENRAKFPLSVTRAVRAALPSELPLIVRISCDDFCDGGFTLQDASILGSWLKSCGVDLIDCSGGGLSPAERYSTAPGYQVKFSQLIRSECKIATSAVGLITDASHAESILEDGSADLIFIGRAFLHDPYWAMRAAHALGTKEACDWPLPYRRAVNGLLSRRGAKAQ